MMSEPSAPRPLASVVGNGANSGVAVAAPSGNAGHWTHLVRYRVRVGDGAFRAGIASTWNPPPPPPVVLDDGTVIPPGPPPPPDPPLMTIVAAGDVLPGGLVVAEIGEKDVLVRDPQTEADADARALRNDPGPSDRPLAGASCPTGAADARDFVYCRVRQ